MLKIKVGDFRIEKEEKEAVNQVLDSGQISEGIKVKEFEKKWAEYIGTKYCVTTNSGTSALIAGLTALKYYSTIKIKSRKKYVYAVTYNVESKTYPAFYVQYAGIFLGKAG